MVSQRPPPIIRFPEYRSSDQQGAERETSTRRYGTDELDPFPAVSEAEMRSSRRSIRRRRRRRGSSGGSIAAKEAPEITDAAPPRSRSDFFFPLPARQKCGTNPALHR